VSTSSAPCPQVHTYSVAFTCDSISKSRSIPFDEHTVDLDVIDVLFVVLTPKLTGIVTGIELTPTDVHALIADTVMIAGDPGLNCSDSCKSKSNEAVSPLTPCFTAIPSLFVQI
jgi:hypothetical protein